MKHDKLKVSKMVDELMNYFFSLSSRDIRVEVREGEGSYNIRFTAVVPEMTDKEKTRLLKLLKCGKRAEMEEYYWCLAGESDLDSELTLVGVMADRVDIKYGEAGEVDINIERKK